MAINFPDNPTAKQAEEKRRIKIKIMKQYDEMRDRMFPGWRKGGAS